MSIQLILGGFPLDIQATAPEHIEGLIDQAELGKALEKRARVTQELNRTVEITKKMYEKLDGCINRVGE